MYFKCLVKILLPVMDLNMTNKTLKTLQNTCNSDFRKTREIRFLRDISHSSAPYVLFSPLRTLLLYKYQPQPLTSPPRLHTKINTTHNLVPSMSNFVVPSPEDLAMLPSSFPPSSSPGSPLIAQNVTLEEDKTTVLALWLAMGGEQTTLTTRYGYLKSPSEDMTQWYGLTVEGGRVTKIFWHLCGLTGTIPAIFGALSALTWLDLGRNQLVGAIPPELGALENLVGLNLSDNYLSTDSVPTTLFKLKNLKQLKLLTSC